MRIIVIIQRMLIESKSSERDRELVFKPKLDRRIVARIEKEKRVRTRKTILPCCPKLGRNYSQTKNTHKERVIEIKV